MKKTLIKVATLALAMGSVPLSYGFEAGDWLVRVGAINVDPDNSPAEGDLVGDVDVDDDTQIGLNFAYFVTDTVAVELLAATPFKHDIDTELGVTGETKHLPPTLMALWYPNDPSSAVQPYIGAGINHTIFFEEEVSIDNELKIDDSWGWSAQVGIDYQLSDNIFVNGQIRYIDISTEAEVKDGVDEFDLDIDPFVYMVGLGFKL